MEGNGVLACDLRPIAQSLQSLQTALGQTGVLTALLQLLHGQGTAPFPAHQGCHHLARLKVAGGLAGTGLHHAASHIRHHCCELGEGVIPHLFKVAIPHQRGLDPWHRVAEFGERDGLAVIQLLPVRASHRHGGGLIKALIQQQRQQCRQHTWVLLVIGVAEAGEHR